MDKVRDFNEPHDCEYLMQAEACAKSTIHWIYDYYQDKACLSDVDMDKLKDALQCLLWIQMTRDNKPQIKV